MTDSRIREAAPSPYTIRSPGWIRGATGIWTTMREAAGADRGSSPTGGNLATTRASQTRSKVSRATMSILQLTAMDEAKAG